MAVLLIAYDVNQNVITEANSPLAKAVNAARTDILNWIKKEFLDKKKGVKLSESSYAIKPVTLTQEQIFDQLITFALKHKVKDHIGIFVIPLVQIPLGHPDKDRLKWLQNNLPECDEVLNFDDKSD